jgi:hypothetical protein
VIILTSNPGGGLGDRACHQRLHLANSRGVITAALPNALAFNHHHPPAAGSGMPRVL